MYTLQVKTNAETKVVVMQDEDFQKIDVYIPEVKVSSNILSTDKILDSLKHVLHIIKHRNKIIKRGACSVSDRINKMLRELADLLMFAYRNNTCVVFN